jgi:lipopolysaccharide/colanic/teichoic acid biosynthesis glycosyltransferase
VSIHENIADPAMGGVPSVQKPDALAACFSADQAAIAPANLNNSKAMDDAIYASFKRGLDLAIAIPAAIVLAPVLVLLAALIRLDSKGPVLFRQTRLGLNGRPFDVVKFRTMTVLENGEIIRQAHRGDTRITRVGRFLRSCSLDELPQLINVIRGEMSIIGPRPHARAHDLMYAKLIDCYVLRQAIKPGITGWAQVHGLRGETPTIESMRARVDYDIWYVKNANIALDMEILLRTALEVLRRRNVY